MTVPVGGVLGGRDVTDLTVQPGVDVLGDPPDDGPLELRLGAPGPLQRDEFRFECAVHDREHGSLGGEYVQAVRAGFLTYRHSGEPADVIYSRYALHHLPDFWKAIALRRMADMLRSGGVLRLWDVVYSMEYPERTTDENEARMVRRLVDLTGIPPTEHRMR